MAAQTVHHDEGRRIRELANNPSTRFLYRKHAQEEMRNDHISKLDVLYVLRRGSVVRVEQSLGDETWNVRGSDGDGRRLEIVVVAYEDRVRVKVITAWARKAS
ncbi:MAG: DUF4258 domain-containing protein [Tistlia sp.]|uniref:DUF4258 domain-containing protein n=1 Tax=Tistlia sp. TaxID=3057121 RepID=UPI0034A3EB8E